MSRIFFDGRDLEIAIRRDGIERVYPLASIAVVLRIDAAHLRARIESLLNAAEDLSTCSTGTVPSPTSPSTRMMVGEPTEGTVPIRSDAVQQESNLDRSDTSIGPVQAMVASNNLGDVSPEFLAQQLGDVPNTAALAVLVRHVPPSLISDALNQALAIPAGRLRTNRAALFTTIVRRLVRERQHPSPYARS